MTALLDYIAANAGVIGLIFFVIFFLLVLLWLYRPGAKEQFEQHGNIPLKEDNHEQ